MTSPRGDDTFGEGEVKETDEAYRPPGDAPPARRILRLKETSRSLRTVLGGGSALFSPPSLYARLRKSRLRNGPTLLLLPDSKAPAVAVQIWLPAGTYTESPGDEGLSHFLEHMIFKGSRRLAVGELASRAEAAGGDINAYTMADSTYYHLTCLSEGLETCLDALAEAVWWPRFDVGEVRRERGVVLAEIGRADDEPGQQLQKRLFRKAFGSAHPYGRPILGSRAAVARMDEAALRRYHRRCYAPSSAVVVVAGPVSERRVRACLERKLRELPRGFFHPSPHARRRTAVDAPRPEGRGPRAFALRGRSGLAHLEISFAVPPFTHPDAAALESLAIILGMGDSSRLFQRLCLQTPLMHDVSAEIMYSAGPGLFFLGGLAEPGRLESACGQILRIARAVCGAEPPTEEELERVRLCFQAELEFRREGVAGTARVAGYSQLVTGDPRFAEVYLKRVLAVKERDLRRVAIRYLTPENLTAGAFFPASGNGAPNGRLLGKAVRLAFRDESVISRNGRGAAKKIETPAPPRKAPPARRKIPFRGRRARRKSVLPYRGTLPGGGRLVVLPGGTARVCALRAVFLGGQRLEGREWTGLHALMSNVASQATREMSSEELARRVDGLAASLSGFSGRNSFGVSSSFLSSVLPEMVEIFSDLICTPAFDPEDVAVGKREAEAGRRSDLDDLGHLSRLRVMRLLYGDHPFARHPLGSRRSYARMDARLLRRAWRRWAVPGNLVIGAAGDVDPGDLARRFRRLMKRWADSAPRWRAPAAPPPPRPPVRSRTRRLVVEHAVQSHIHLAFLGAALHDPRRFALAVVAAALGSQGGGLFMELRERRGLAYAVNVSAEEALDPGPVTFYAATAPGAEEEAIALMHAEIARARETGLSEAEIDRAKAFLIGEHVRAHQRASARASDLAFGERYGLDFMRFEQLRSRIEAVDCEAARDVARVFLDPRRECLVRLGPPPKTGRETKQY